MFAQTGPRLEESPKLILEDEQPTQPRYDVNIQIGVILMIFYWTGEEKSWVLFPRVRQNQTQVLVREPVPGRRFNSIYNIQDIVQRSSAASSSPALVIRSRSRQDQHSNSPMQWRFGWKWGIWQLSHLSWRLYEADKKKQEISEEDFSCPDSYKHSESSKPTHRGTAPTTSSHATSDSSASPSTAIGPSNCPSFLFQDLRYQTTLPQCHLWWSGDPLASTLSLTTPDTSVQPLAALASLSPPTSNTTLRHTSTLALVSIPPTPGY